jgi:hypothetical protein
LKGGRRLRAFENRVLRRRFWSKRDEVTGEWRKLHDQKLNNLYCSPNIVPMIKSSRLRWAGHVACMGRRDVYTGFWWGNLRERDHLEDPAVNGRIILKLLLRKWDGKAWTGLIWLKIGTGGGLL